MLGTLKSLEHSGYHFEVADGSLELLLRRATGWGPDYFELETFRVISDHNGVDSTEATVKVRVSGERVVATAEGNGPVNALDSALRQAIGKYYPSLAHIHLVDYRVRVLDTKLGTGAVTRVLIDTTDGEITWTTIGVSENIIEASWRALYDSIVYGLLHSEDGATSWRPTRSRSHDPTELCASSTRRPGPAFHAPEDTCRLEGRPSRGPARA